MSLLAQVDTRRALTAEEYTAALARWQPMLAQLVRRARAEKRGVVVVCEGWDPADRLNVIRRLTERLDSRGYAVHALAEAEGDDATHHYLYRFWRRLPPRGHVAIFDSSWYRRVLAERVEGICGQDQWQRAYREINQFERQLVEFGTIVLKFWLHISAEEGARRFAAATEEHQQIASTLHPEKRAAYEAAVEEMLLKTNTLLAPWTVVEADNPFWSCIRVLRTAVEVLDGALPKPAASEEGAPPAEEAAAAEKLADTETHQAEQKERTRVKARKGMDSAGG
ncbi:MAG: hypothetical protein N2204_02995 [Anaerolineae bacterium]|nr:hypothetical protein [Anaerolineae bacterium]